MSELTASIDRIKRQAEAAADQALGTHACIYPSGSEAEDIWMDAYFARVAANFEKVAA